MALTLAQQRALAIIPKFTGSMSMLGSGFIIQDVLRDPVKRKRTYSKLLLGVSIFDVVASFFYFLSTWPIPAGSPPLYAIGTTATCTLQGFFVQFSLGIPMYNLALSIYYLMVLVFNWSDRKVQQVEKHLHIIAISMGVGTAITGLPLKLYNNSNLWCWIAGLPASCASSPSSTGECERGTNAWIFRWALYYGPLWFIILIITFNMTWVTWHVWQQEKTSRKWRKQGGQQQQQQQKDKLRKLSSQVFWQSFHYVCVFYVTYIFPTVLRIQETKKVDVPPFVMIGMCFFVPFQGFLNFTVYLHPRYRHFREKHPETSVFTTILRIVWPASQHPNPNGVNTPIHHDTPPTTTPAKAETAAIKQESMTKSFQQASSSTPDNNDYGCPAEQQRQAELGQPQEEGKLSSRDDKLDDDDEDEEEVDADVLDPSYSIMRCSSTMATIANTPENGTEGRD